MMSVTVIFCLSHRSSSNQIDGSMEYIFQDGDVIQPVSYLKELHSLMGMSKLTMNCSTDTKLCNRKHPQLIITLFYSLHDSHHSDKHNCST